MKNELTIKKANPFFHGDTIQATIKELEKTLGRPLYKQNGSGNPFRVEWVMLDSEDERFFVCDCFQDDYSWLNKRFDETELMGWHIRANNKDSSKRAKNELEQALSKTRDGKPAIQSNPEKVRGQIIDKLKGLEPRVIGRVGVDTAKVWIGDPGHLNEDVLNEINEDWESDFKSWPFENEGNGLGVSVRPTHGDGTYNVIGFFPPAQSTIDESANRPLLVMIDFNRW